LGRVTPRALRSPLFRRGTVSIIMGRPWFTRGWTA